MVRFILVPPSSFFIKLNLISQVLCAILLYRLRDGKTGDKSALFVIFCNFCGNWMKRGGGGDIIMQNTKLSTKQAEGERNERDGWQRWP